MYPLKNYHIIVLFLIRLMSSIMFVTVKYVLSFLLIKNFLFCQLFKYFI